MIELLFRWRSILAIFLALGLNASAQAQTALSEAQVKAGFVLNFARYVEWPERAFASREAPLVICAVGNDNLGAALSALETRQVQGRAIKLRRGINADDLRGCHVAYVADSEQRRLLPTLRMLAGQSVLTVSDIEGFIDAGGAIGIVPGDDRLQFEINRAALDQAQLKASSQLLKLARNVAELKPRY